jgi:hypothetical protein
MSPEKYGRPFLVAIEQRLGRDDVLLGLVRRSMFSRS